MKTIQKILVTISIAMMILTGITAPLFALDLETARATGVAGEVDNGLLAQPPGASNDAKELITKINNERRAEYAKVAAANNVTLDAVGTMMSQKIYARLPAGTWVQIQGKWIKKSK